MITCSTEMSYGGPETPSLMVIRYSSSTVLQIFTFLYHYVLCIGVARWAGGTLTDGDNMLINLLKLSYTFAPLQALWRCHTMGQRHSLTVITYSSSLTVLQIFPLLLYYVLSIGIAWLAGGTLADGAYQISCNFSHFCLIMCSVLVLHGR